MKTVHMMGIGGTGMVALSGLFREAGWSVRGSDANVYPPASDELARLNVKVIEGYKAENLFPRPDLVVVGNVISRGNPEAEALLKTDIPYSSMAHALAEHFIDGKRSVVICGTHGKSTTTSLMSWVFDHADRAPGFFVGAIPLNFGQGYRGAKGDVFVIEGDEYDTAFFEKTPKFLHYRPHDVVLTSVEFDHADIYRDLKHVVEQFERLMIILPPDGVLVACGDHETVRSVVRQRKGPVTWYGEAESCEWRPGKVEATGTGTNFEVLENGKAVAHVRSPLLGHHNVLNALSCMAMAKAHGISLDVVTEAIESFRGLRRRQEFVGEARGIRIYDDFAHHPTAIEQTIAAFRPMVDRTGGRLWAMFEPRSNTVRRRVFQKVLPESFRLADEVILAPVYKKPDALGSSELLSPEEVAQSIVDGGRKGRAATTPDEIIEMLTREGKPGDLFLFMSNGSFGGLPARTLQRLSA